MARKRRRSNFNPFISLTDVLFNLILVLIFASAIFAQDINRKYAENRAFQQRLAAVQLERDALIANVEALTGDLEEAEQVETDLRDMTLSLEEQIAGLVGNLDLAQLRQQRLEDRISVVLGDLDLARLQNENLETKLTVVLGDLDLAEEANKVLEDEITIVSGALDQAQSLAGALRNQVSKLSRNNFLVVELEWLTESHDLDLHVTDPNGNRFFWNSPTYPDATARLTLDNRLGARPNRPGLEIWTARELEVGTYRIEVGLWGCDRTSETSGYQTCSSDAPATLLVRHRDGDDVISNVTIPLNQSYAQASGSGFVLSDASFNRLQLIAEVEVTEEEGEVRVEVVPAEGLLIERFASTQ